jgi:hypothetical protein
MTYVLLTLGCGVVGKFGLRQLQLTSLERRTIPMKTKGISVLVILVMGALLSQPLCPLAAAQEIKPTTEGDEVTVPDGTEFEVLTTEEISSKTSSENDPVNFKVADDVKINGRVVIAKDTMVKGLVANVEKRGHLGKGGKLGLRVESTTTVDGQRVKLRAAKGKGDTDTVGSTIALSLLISPLFLLRRGNHAVIKPGTKIKVYTDEDKKVKVPAK